MFGLCAEQWTAIATVVMAGATVVLAILAYANWRVATEMKTLSASNLKLTEEMKLISERATKGSLSDLFKAGREAAMPKTIRLYKTLESMLGAAPRTDLKRTVSLAAQEWYEDDFVKRVVQWDVKREELEALASTFASAPEARKKALTQKVTDYAAALRSIEREQMQYNPAVLDRWYRAL
jgi:hypothetical protein